MRSAASNTPAPQGLAAWLQRALAKADKPGWRAFAVSMLALALAFILAMYSTIFAQQGQVVPTAICAVSALALAAYVAFTAIPYLARRTQIEWLQVSLDYRVTREGWAFILLILILAVAGLNTGNNLLYMILSSLLAALLVSGILSLAVLNGVDLDLEIPEHVFARRPLEALIVMVNLKKYFPSFSLTLEGSGDRDAGSTPGKVVTAWRAVLPRAVMLGLTGGVLAAFTWLLLWKWTSDFFGLRLRSLLGIALISLLAAFAVALTALSWREKKRRQQQSSGSSKDSVSAGSDQHGRQPRGILAHALYFPFLPRGGTVRRQVQMEFPRRGRYREDGLDLSTRFPFGFLEKTMHIGMARDLLVYPAVGPSQRFLEILPLLTGELEAFQRGTGHDLYSIREMVGADSVRHVDWKASARAGQLMVREFAREDDRRIQLILDPRVGILRGKARLRALEQFEAAIEFCASLAWHFHETGAQLEFLCGDYRTRVATASEIIYDILGYLADVTPVDEPPSPAITSGNDENVFRIICTGLPADNVPASAGRQSHIVRFDSLRPAR